MTELSEFTAQYRLFLGRFLKDKQVKRLLALGTGELTRHLTKAAYTELSYPAMIVSEPLPQADCAAVAVDGLFDRLTPFEIGLVVNKLMNVPHVVWLARLEDKNGCVLPLGVPHECASYFKLCRTALLHVNSPAESPIGVLVADAGEIRREHNRELMREFSERLRGYPARVWGDDQKLTIIPYTIDKQVGACRFTFLVANQQAKAWYDQPDSTGLQVDVRADIDFITSNLLQPGDTVFDVGAHHGFYSLCFAKAVNRFGRVLAFEPAPHCADIVRANAKLNKVSNLTVHEIGLKADKGVLRMFLPALSPVYDPVQQDDGVDVRVGLLDEFAGEKPGFIKINCGGYEVPVLRGATRVLARCPNLALRVHPEGLERHGHSVGELLKLVNWQHYACWFVDRHSEIKPWNSGVPINHETTIFAKSLQSKFKVVMLHDEHRVDVANVSVPNAQAYCAKHGYELVLHDRLIDPNLNGSWNKLKAVRQALCDTDWVLWLDTDAIFTQPEYTLAELTAEFCKNKPLGISTDYNGICMGVFLIRNCPWSLQLLDTLIYLGEGQQEKMLQYDAHNRWEQNTMKCLMDFFPEVAEGVALIPDSVIQNPKAKFNQHAFIAHFWAGAGGNPKLAIEKMQHATKQGWSEMAL